MTITYKKLWKKLIDEEMTKTDLLNELGISSSTLTKLSQDQNVSLDILIRVCEVFKCQLSDICEVLDEQGKVLGE